VIHAAARVRQQVKAGVRKAMAKFQQLSVAELYADEGLHLLRFLVCLG
jgi:hypothetical protein